MSDLLLTRIDTTRIYPAFLERLRSMLDEAQRKHHANYWVISGDRTYGEQDALYAIGRSKPGKIVTHARAGQSAHNFGVAVDLCLDGVVDRRGLQPDWRPESYELLRTLAPKHGLVWGGSWKFVDNAHVQIPGFVTAAEMQPLRDRYEMRGLQSVFDYLREQPS